MRASARILIALLFIALFSGCPDKDPETNLPDTGSTATPQPKAPPTPVYGYEVVKSYPHDTAAYTQGLIFRDGALYEGTGLHDSSSIRKVDLETGKVERKFDLDAKYFGEGLTMIGDKLYQITWRNNVGFVYDLFTFRPIDTFQIYGEGWGLTTDGSQLYLSDGSEFLRILDPATLEVRRVIPVSDGSRPVRFLNELELIKGEIWANIWQTDSIVRIDPASGNVKGWVNLSGILPASERSNRVDVLNGIAYDPKGDRIFVTGKFWPKLYEIRVKGGADSTAAPALR